MTGAYVRTVASMGTVVTVHVVDDRGRGSGVEASVDRALAWFDEVERVCSRFDPESELSRLSARIGERVVVSNLLFEAVRFALSVAEESGGAFDPTLGLTLEAHGFNREHRTGRAITRSISDAEDASYRDVHIDGDKRTLMIARPLVLDLGAVAKGLAIDMATRSLRDDGFADFAVDAGGDLYLAGRNAKGEPWSVGIRHPRLERTMIETLRVSDIAVCTSGDYERPVMLSSDDDASLRHHLVDPRSGASPADVASVTVLAPSAMVADALATAAFVLGPREGIVFLERQGVDGVIFTRTLERFSTHS